MTLKGFAVLGCATCMLYGCGERTPEMQLIYDAAEAMGITSSRLKELGLIDHIVREPLGGAHRDVDQMAKDIQDALVRELKRLDAFSVEQLIDSRYERLLKYGEFTN